MKKIKLNGKLSLNKETIAKLNDKQMNDVKGGFDEKKDIQTSLCTSLSDEFAWLPSKFRGGKCDPMQLGEYGYDKTRYENVVCTIGFT
jgi:natural product precursor